MKEMKKEPLILNYMGDDDFAMPVYQDQFGHYWKDVNLGEPEQPYLYSVLGNTFDGDPNTPITQEFTIITKKETVSKEKQFQYQMLSRLISDCEYYLGNGYRNPNHLWAKTEERQIEEIKKIWNSFADEEKPEWLTWKQIERYEKDMIFLNKLRPGVKFMENAAKSEIEITEIIAAASCTENWKSDPVTVLRDVSTGREYYSTVESLKNCNITITEEPDSTVKWAAISDSIMHALLCREFITLNMSNYSVIRGIVLSIDMKCATIKESNLFGRSTVVLFEQINSIFAA